MNAQLVQRTLKHASNPVRAQVSQSFFKTDIGEYGEGDVFIGVTMPDIRKVARKYRALPLKEVDTLLQSEVHEERMCALIILIDQFEHGDKKTREDVYRYYLNHTDRINNWDLVDVSVYKIVGAHLLHRSRKPLYKLARSTLLWERRMAIVATYAFIRENDVDETFLLAERLLRDEHDLMHKAVGWMLREAGKRDEARLRRFLDAHTTHMPRTMLRYAIERLTQSERKHYLKAV